MQGTKTLLIKEERKSLWRRKHSDGILEKKRFLLERTTTLKPKKYWSFKIVKKINDNAYVVNFPCDMVISKTFNVADLHDYQPPEQLYPYNYSRMSFFWRGRNWCRRWRNKTTSSLKLTLPVDNTLMFCRQGFAERKKFVRFTLPIDSTLLACRQVFTESWVLAVFRLTIDSTLQLSTTQSVYQCIRLV